MGLRSRLRRRVDAAIAWRVQVALGDRVEGLEREVGDLRARLDAAAGEASWANNQLDRLAPQIAALEQRLERTARAARSGGSPTATAVAAGEPLDGAAEHERIRARQALVSAYEERLRRLERVSRP